MCFRPMGGDVFVIARLISGISKSDAPFGYVMRIVKSWVEGTEEGMDCIL